MSPRSEDWKPKPLTDYERGHLIGELKMGATREGAALAIGINPRQLRYKLQHYPELREEVEAAEQVPGSEIRKKIIQAAKDGNVVAMIFSLKNLLGWSDRRHVSATINVHQHPRALQASYHPEVIAAARKRIEERNVAGLLEARKIVEGEILDEAIGE